MLTVHQWLIDSKQVPFPCCVADYPEFIWYISLEASTAGPWFKLSVFCKLELNNTGSLAARENNDGFFFCPILEHFCPLFAQIAQMGSLFAQMGSL